MKFWGYYEEQKQLEELMGFTIFVIKGVGLMIVCASMILYCVYKLELYK